MPVFIACVYIIVNILLRCLVVGTALFARSDVRSDRAMKIIELIREHKSMR